MGITKNTDGTVVVATGDQKQTFKTEQEADQFLSKAFGYDKGRAEFAEERKAVDAEKVRIAAEKAEIEKAKTTSKDATGNADAKTGDDDWLKGLFGDKETAEVDADKLAQTVDGRVDAKLQAQEAKLRAAGEAGAMTFLMERDIDRAVKASGVKGTGVIADIRNAVIEKLRANPSASFDDIPEFAKQAVKERKEEFTALDAAEKKADEERKLAEARIAGTNPADLARGGPRIELAENVKPFSAEHRKAQLDYINAQQAAHRI